MKSVEFYAFFPRANVKHFHEDSDNNVLFDPKAKFNPDDILDDVGEPAFWQGIGPTFLGLSTEDLQLWKKDKLNFWNNYRKKHYFHQKKNDSNVDLEILDKKFWEPIEFSLNSNLQPPPVKLTNFNINFEEIRIYVSPNDFFVIKDNFPNFSKTLEINWEDEKNEYTLFLKAMYVLSYLGGMSIQNLQNENNLAKSLSHFYFYYHLKKYLNYRNFSGFDFTPLEEVKLFHSLYHWDQHRVHYFPHMKMGDKEFKRNKHDVIENVKKVGKWITWETRGAKRNLSKDYLKLISDRGEGLTKLGQLLFQESNQAYIYAVLGAQAKTHWKIIGDGANSYQTQNVFKDLVKEVTQQNNLSILIKSMRLAIASTKVRLDFCISPGLELLPSHMIYIKDSPGYNNILLISSKNQKFGTNNVNGVEKYIENKKPESLPEKNTSTQNKNQISVKDAPQSTHSMVPVVISAGFIAFALRFVWVLI